VPLVQRYGGAVAQRQIRSSCTDSATEPLIAWAVPGSCASPNTPTAGGCSGWATTFSEPVESHRRWTGESAALQSAIDSLRVRRACRPGFHRVFTFSMIGPKDDRCGRRLYRSTWAHSDADRCWCSRSRRMPIIDVVCKPHRAIDIGVHFSGTSFRAWIQALVGREGDGEAQSSRRALFKNRVFLLFKFPQGPSDSCCHWSEPPVRSSSKHVAAVFWLSFGPLAMVWRRRVILTRSSREASGGRKARRGAGGCGFCAWSPRRPACHVFPSSHSSGRCLTYHG